MQGLYGIQTARTYLDIHAKAQVLILEAGKMNYTERKL
jgi:hypothetical protein